MERVALERRPIDRGIEKAKVETAVVPDQDRPLAAIGLERLTDTTEDLAQRLLFTHSHAQRVIQLDAGEIQRRLLDIGPGERFDTEEIGVLRKQQTLLVHADGDRGNFQQGIGGRIEATGLDIHHHRQVATETTGHRRFEAAAVRLQFVFVVLQILTHRRVSSAAAHWLAAARLRNRRTAGWPVPSTPRVPG